MTELENKVSEYQRKKREIHYPHDVMVEMSFLGCILLGGKKVFDTVEYLVNEQDFYRPGHQAIFTAMKKVLNETQGSCDIVLLNEELTKANQIDLVGGLAYLMQLGDLEYTTQNAPVYAKGIKRYANLRNIVINAEYAMGRAQETDTDPEIIALDFAKGTESKVATNTISNASDVLRAGIDSLRSGKRKGIPTGFRDIERVVNGWKNGELIIVGGRPSMGKSSLGLQYAINASINCRKEGKGGALFISVEMSEDMISQRLLQIVGGINAQGLGGAYISQTEQSAIIKAQSEVDTLPLFFSTETPVTVASIRAKARELQRQNKLSILVVDYLQMLETGKETQGRTRDIGVLSRGLKSLAKEFDIPVIALSSLSRASEQRNDKRPIMSDLRESGDIESDADVVQFLYRPDYYDENRSNWDDDSPSETEIITAKNRNGSIGVSKVEFKKSLAKFSDLPLEGLL
jgi:replicative DNA helicase